MVLDTSVGVRVKGHTVLREGCTHDWIHFLTGSLKALEKSHWQSCLQAVTLILWYSLREHHDRHAQHELKHVWGAETFWILVGGTPSVLTGLALLFPNVIYPTTSRTIPNVSDDTITILRVVIALFAMTFFCCNFILNKWSTHYSSLLF